MLRSATSEVDNIEGPINSCTLCVPGYRYGTKISQQVLEHVGAHILHDPKIALDEPCDKYLRTSSVCPIFLSRGARGKPKINAPHSSGCRNPVYVPRYLAATSSATSSTRAVFAYSNCCRQPLLDRIALSALLWIGKCILVYVHTGLFLTI